MLGKEESWRLPEEEFGSEEDISLSGDNFSDHLAGEAEAQTRTGRTTPPHLH